MVSRAFVLIETEDGKSKEVSARLRLVKGIKSAELVSYPYNIIAIVEGKADDIDRLLESQIQGIRGIIRAVTCPATGSFSRLSIHR